MATKNEKQGCGWLDSKLNLTDEFANGSFEKLVEYSKENELNLMRIWMNGDADDVNKILQYGTAILKYFEATIAEDSKAVAAYKLGEVSGYLGCLNHIVYENQQNYLAMHRFESVKLLRPKFKTEFEDVIKAFSKVGGKSLKEKELLNMVSLNLLDLTDVLILLTRSGFLHFYESLGYSLSDTGCRLMKELSKTNTN